MNIVATQYTLASKSLEIYLAGCLTNPKCKNCHNPELWSFDIGDKYDEKYFQLIKEKVQDFNSLIENIMIMGGEPNHQDLQELLRFLANMQSLGKPLWVFTSQELSHVPWFEKVFCDYIKTGQYLEHLKTDTNIQYGIKLATSNQHIYKRGIDY